MDVKIINQDFLNLRIDFSKKVLAYYSKALGNDSLTNLYFLISNM
jgi:hypothetical protein